MYRCYIDESGTPDVPGNTSLTTFWPVSPFLWKILASNCDKAIEAIKTEYDLRATKKSMSPGYCELIRNKTKSSASIEWTTDNVGMKVTAFRTAELLRLQRSKNPSQLRYKEELRKDRLLRSSDNC